MELNRARIVDQQFQERVLTENFPVATTPITVQQAGLDKTTFLELFHSQLISRHLDLLARHLREQQQGFYTIGSSGHEGNAAIAKAFRKEDLAFLHYRSGAFVAQRAKYQPEIDILYEQALSLVASSDDPISGGRHKVFGSVPLFIPPQTSTIASHLPKALGAAFALTQAKTLKAECSLLPKDSVILCSFGDASFNHSTAQGAINAAQWIAKAHMPLPLVWICEDNGIGISVPTPADWIAQKIQSQPFLHYIACDGRQLADVYQAAVQAEHFARKKGQVVFLHMKTARLLGHAGSDIESHYRSNREIEQTEADDPLLHSARVIVAQGWLTPTQIVSLYQEVGQQAAKAGQRAIARPKLNSAAEIMSSIIPPPRAIHLPAIPADLQREKYWGKRWEQRTQPRTMAQCLNLALTDILTQYPQTLIFGEDVGKKGGVYRITADLQAHFGPARVFDTLLDEQTILGTAIGLAHNGFLPIPEIQFLAYVHNAVDQIRGEASTLSFFSRGQYTNPMVVRVPAFAYQKGFGGHFHNDNAIAFLREIPGIVLVVPSTAQDAALLLRQSVQLAYQAQRVVIFLEPIALYMVKDLYQTGDNLALNIYPDLSEDLAFGQLGMEGDKNSDTVIISYGNGMYLSRQAAFLLQQRHQISCQLIDLRWLTPINTLDLKQAIDGKKNILIVDECRRTGSVSEWLLSWMQENLSHRARKISRLTAEDSFIPLGNAWEHILPSCEQIITAVLTILKE